MPAGRSFVDAAEDVVKRLRDAPVDMAYFTAVDQPPAQVCRQALAECDVYVGIATASGYCLPHAWSRVRARSPLLLVERMTS